MRRCGAFAIVAGVIASWTSGAAQDITLSWYPLQPGDTWIYQKESLDGNMAHPSVERWTTEETIVSAVTVPELAGALVTKRTKVLSHTVPPDFIPGNDSTRHELRESHLLIHQGCLYVLDGIDALGAACAQTGLTECVRALDGSNRVRPEYRDVLLRGNIPADFCFPMVVGMTWGRFPSRLQPTIGCGT